AEPPRLWLVTRGAQTAGGEASPPRLTGAPLWGLGRVIAAEHPRLWGGIIDLPAVPEAEEGRQLVEAIFGAEGDDQQVIRGSARRAPRLVRSRSRGLAARSSSLRADATYLITGGTGALGLEVARWMVAAGARRLLLVSRTGGSDDATRAVDELR